MKGNALIKKPILVTGDRNWADGQIIELILRGLYEMIDEREEALEVVHGGAKGADSLAGQAVENINTANKKLRLSPILVSEHKAKWDEHGRAAGPIRNIEMVTKHKIQLAFAFHNDLENSRGTKHMVGELKKLDIPTYIIQRTERCF